MQNVLFCWSSGFVISGWYALSELDENTIYCVYISRLLLRWPENLSATFYKVAYQAAEWEEGPPIISN